jgi:hypothetical protein
MKHIKLYEQFITEKKTDIILDDAGIKSLDKQVRIQGLPIVINKAKENMKNPDMYAFSKLYPDFQSNPNNYTIWSVNVSTNLDKVLICYTTLDGSWKNVYMTVGYNLKNNTIDPQYLYFEDTSKWSRTNNKTYSDNQIWYNSDKKMIR